MQKNVFLAIILVSSNLFGQSTICEPSEPGENIGDTGCVNLTYRGQIIGLTTVRAADGNVWIQQNLGSAQVAETYDDESAYGDLFQWGRFDDGHQLRNSEMTDIYPEPNNPIGLGTEGNPKFFSGGGSPYDSYTGWWGDWTFEDKWEAATLEEVTEENALDPCKAIGSDWYIPTREDWENVIATEGIGEDPNLTNTESASQSNLKLTAAGVRKDDELAFVGTRGYYWSRSTSDNDDFIKYLYYSNYIVNAGAGDAKKQGSSVRCLKYGSELSNVEFTMNDLKIYPNPTNGILNIESKNEIKRIEIFDLTGSKLLSSKSKTLQLNQLPKGIYLVKVSFQNNGTKTVKIIKK